MFKSIQIKLFREGSETTALRSLSNHLCQVCLKLAQWFWRKQNIKAIKVILPLPPLEKATTRPLIWFLLPLILKRKSSKYMPYHHYLLSGKGMTLIRTIIKKMLVWNLPWSSEDLVKKRKLDLWKTTHKGSVPVRSGEKIRQLKFCVIVWSQNVLTLMWKKIPMFIFSISSA